MKKLRQCTVEPVFGSLTQFYGLRKIGVLGKTGAHVMLMAAIAFNLNKYLKKEGGYPQRYFQDNHGCISKLPDHFYPSNPIKAGHKGSVKTTCLSGYLTH